MIIDQIISQVMSRPGLSDIHIHADKPLALRINGEIETFSDQITIAQAVDQFFGTHLSPEQLQQFQEKGDVDLALVIDGQRFRASFARGSEGKVVVLRRLESKIPMPEDLGLPPALLAVTQLKSGLVLVTGPTGSGKSTSLAAVINRINEERSDHILTVEDPIEYVHHNRKSIVFQREVGQDTKSFAQALKAALREDPDVILVGEMRDIETVGLALTAAETGHLVFGTLHTNGAASTVNRIIDVFPAAQQGQIRAQLAQSLRLVMTQRLLKKADGSGRVGAFEVMVCNHAIRSLIREAKLHQIEGVMQTSRGEGMVTMDAALEELAAMGMIQK